MKMKKLIAMVIASVLAVSVIGCGGSSTEMSASSTSAANTPAVSPPTQEAKLADEITFVIPFSDTSGCNTVWRAFGAELGKQQNVTVLYDNQAGASGAVGITYYMNGNQRDGKSVLCMSESVTMFKAQGLADWTYDDFEPLLLASANCGILVTYPGSVFDGMDFNETIEYLKMHPGVTVGATGVGGMAWLWYTILNKVYGIELNVVDYDNSGDGNTQLMGKHIELFVNGYTSGKPLIDAGSVVPIVVFDNERLSGLSDIPSVSEYSQDLDKYLPNGSFFVAAVPKDTPSDIVEVLREAFISTAESDAMQTWYANNSGRYLGLTGDEATAYMKKQQAVNSYLLYDAGVSDVDPATYGMTRP
jgi:tripartite-type tricarboxylate transporter receptor subunit TctC